MKHISDYIFWIFALIFMVGAIGIFPESLAAGISCFLFGASLAPFIWQNIKVKNKNIIRITVPILFFVITILTI